MNKILLAPILIPFLAGILSFIIPKKFRTTTGIFVLYATFVNLWIAITLFKQTIVFVLPWAGLGLEFSLKVYHFSAFIILSIAALGFLIMLYSTVFMREKPFLNPFYAYFLITLSCANGAVLSNNLVILLFFWEALLCTLFGFIAIGRRGAFKTATKAFIIVGISDLCLMVGIALAGFLAGTLTMSGMHIPLTGLGSLAFILMMIGAISKGGCMPFHSWIPDAALDAPLPFMALIPGALEKLLGIYLLTRISLDIFALDVHSWLSTVMMTIGALTILLAVMMALIQKDYKRLLSYHAISQVGYMILGIGTAVPLGIVGGIFHMINNALYKSGLFLSAGAVEKQTNTTNLEELGGLARKMPITFFCFLVTALSISGVPPFNGFFSKELIYDAALERNLIFYVAAVLGSFLTAASFLKLGHAAFLGPLNEKHKTTKEVSFPMWLPMGAIALVCIYFGVFNSFPIRCLIMPILGTQRLQGQLSNGFVANPRLVAVTVFVLIAALLNHLFGVKRKGKAVMAVDHIHHAPILFGIYEKAEKRYFDPFEWGLQGMRGLSKIAYACDRAIDWVYDCFTVKLTFAFTRLIQRLHNGNYATYLAWSLAGLFLVILFLMRSV